MKRIIKLFVLAIAFLCVCACFKQDPLLLVQPSSINLAQEGDSQPITINANMPWIISGCPGWLSLSAQQGEGNTTVVVSALENTDPEPHTATLLISAADASTDPQSVTVTQPGIGYILKTNATSVMLKPQPGETQTISVTSNTTWSISNIPEWLSVSPISGNGDAELKLTPLTENYSSAPRKVTITINAKELSSLSVDIEVSQEGILIPNCTVKPTGMVVLYNCIGMGWEYDKNVNHYYYGTMLKTDADRMTSREIVESLVKSESPITPGDNYISSRSSLSSLTEYYLFTVAFDKNGDQGDLISVPFTTKSDTNIPFVYLDNFTWDGTYIYWSTTMNAFVKMYYMFASDSYYYYRMSDGLIAYVFAGEMRDHPSNFIPMVQNDSWRFALSTIYFTVATWAVDINGEFSGAIARWSGTVSSSSSLSLQNIESEIRTESLTKEQYDTIRASTHIIRW